MTTRRRKKKTPDRASTSVARAAFRVNEAPILRGARDDGRMTLSQQGVRLGLVSVQLELSLRLRLVLKDDPEKTRGFARAVVGAWEDVADICDATRSGNE